VEKKKLKKIKKKYLNSGILSVTVEFIGAQGARSFKASAAPLN
jgi:hypothetical protein